MGVTIQDIAQAAGVSRGTVDRVLHNRPNVHPLVRARVMETVERLGYRPRQAQGQTAGSKRVVIFIPPWTDGYFHRQISSGVKRAARYLQDPSFQVSEHILHSVSPAELVRAIGEELARGMDGMIVQPSFNPEVYARIEQTARAGIPVVTYDADLSDSARLCHVGQDQSRLGAIAAGIMAKLMRRNERALVITGNMKMSNHKGRADGFCNRLFELGYTSDNYEILECFELASLTAEMVEEALNRDIRIRYIYMATQSVSGCVSGIRHSLRRDTPPHLIATDLTPIARKYLLEGVVDYVIDQAFWQESYKAILAMYQILHTGRPPRDEIQFIDSSIVSREMIE